MEMHGYAWDWVQNAKGMQENEGKYPGNVCEWVQSTNRMQWNAGECQGNVSGCNVGGECREIPGGRMDVGPWCQGKAGE